MKTVVISGSSSNVGKTSLAEWFLRRLPGWSALKITVKNGSRCPRKSSCKICDELKNDFDIVAEEEIIGQKGTDTWRFKKAGAKKVVWLKTTSKGLKPGLKKSLDSLKDSEGVVIEGTSVLRFIKPDLTIYLKRKSSCLRPVAKEAEKKADIVIYIDG